MDCFQGQPQGQIQIELQSKVKPSSIRDTPTHYLASFHEAVECGAQADLSVKGSTIHRPSKASKKDIFHIHNVCSLDTIIKPDQCGGSHLASHYRCYYFPHFELIASVRSTTVPNPTTTVPTPTATIGSWALQVHKDLISSSSPWKKSNLSLNRSLTIVQVQIKSHFKVKVTCGFHAF